MLDREMDNSKNAVTKLIIFRYGKKLEQTVNLYNINNNKISRMVNFSSAILFEVDDYISNKSGILLKSLAIASV